MRWDAALLDIELVFLPSYSPNLNAPWYLRLIVLQYSSAMIFYVPYGTDAPIYHRPIITIAMIVINYIVYVMLAASPFGSISETAEPYMLAIGSGLHPVQWLTNNFLHVGFFHFLGNMFFLWIFGLVIEGKIGPYKMLAVYLGIGVLYGAAMRQYLERHQEQAVFVRIMFAQALLVQNKPKSAMKILDEISSEGAQHSAIPKIRAKAEAMLQKNLDEGIYEIEE